MDDKPTLHPKTAEDSGFLGMRDAKPGCRPWLKVIGLALVSECLILIPQTQSLNWKCHRILTHVTWSQEYLRSIYILIKEKYHWILTHATWLHDHLRSIYILMKENYQIIPPKWMKNENNLKHRCGRKPFMNAAK